MNSIVYANFKTKSEKDLLRAAKWCEKYKKAYKGRLSYQTDDTICYRFYKAVPNFQTFVDRHLSKDNLHASLYVETLRYVKRDIFSDDFWKHIELQK